MGRRLATVLGLWWIAACGGARSQPATSIAASPPPASPAGSSEAPSPQSAAEPPRPVVAPAVVVEDRGIVLRLPMAVDDYERVVVVQRPGTTLPGPDCADDAVVASLGPGQIAPGAELPLPVKGAPSLRACVFRPGRPDRAAATATHVGQHIIPWIHAVGSGCEATVRIAVEGPVDADATALEIRSLPLALDGSRASSEAICGQGRLVATVPTELLDAVAAVEPDDGDLQVAIDLHESEVGCEESRLIDACLRLADGSVVPGDGTFPRQLELETHRYGQAVATPVGAIAAREVVAGHHLLGRDPQRGDILTVVVEAITDVRYSADVRVVLDSGRVVVLGAEERVWVISDGAFRAAADLEPGVELLHEGGAADRVSRVVPQPRDRYSTQAFDVSSPDTYFRGGYLVGDTKRSPPASRRHEAPTPRAETGLWLRPHAESFDCALGIRMTVARLDEGVRDVLVFVSPSSGARGVAPSPSCSGTASPALRLEGDALRRALAAPRAGLPLELDLEVGGEGARPCGSPYDVVACAEDRDGARRPLDTTFGISGPACLAAGTFVDTPAGPVLVERLARGVAVLAFDEALGRVVTARVRHVRRSTAPVATFHLADGRTVRATREHPFFLPGSDAYRPAGTLRAADALLSRSGAHTAIVAVTAFDEIAEVFDVSVTGPHNFFANGVLVHNY